MKIKLSLRVRPDCEVASWVYDEIKLLEARVDELEGRPAVPMEIAVMAEKFEEWGCDNDLWFAAASHLRHAISACHGIGKEG